MKNKQLLSLYISQYKAFCDDCNVINSLANDLNCRPKDVSKCITKNIHDLDNNRDEIKCSNNILNSLINFIPKDEKSLLKLKVPENSVSYLKYIFGDKYKFSNNSIQNRFIKIKIPRSHTILRKDEIQSEIFILMVGWGKVVFDYKSNFIEIEPPPIVLPRKPKIPLFKNPKLRDAFKEYEKKTENPDINPPIAKDDLTQSIMDAALKQFEGNLIVQNELKDFFDFSKTATKETNEMLTILWELLKKDINAKEEHISSLKGLFNTMIQLSNNINDVGDIIGHKGAILFTLMNDLSRNIEKISGKIISDYSQNIKTQTGEEVLIDIGSNTYLIAENILESLMEEIPQTKIINSIKKHISNLETRQQLIEASEDYQGNVNWQKNHLSNILSFCVEGKIIKPSEKRWIEETFDQFYILLDENEENIPRSLFQIEIRIIGNDFSRNIRKVLWKIFMGLTVLLYFISVANGVDNKIMENSGYLESMRNSSTTVGFGYVQRNYLSEEILGGIGDMKEVIKTFEPSDFFNIFSEEKNMDVSKAYRVISDEEDKFNTEREDVHGKIGKLMKQQIKDWKRINRSMKSLNETSNSDLNIRNALNDLENMWRETEGTEEAQNIARAVKNTIQSSLRTLNFLDMINKMMRDDLIGYGDVPQVQALPIIGSENPTNLPAVIGTSRNIRVIYNQIISTAKEAFDDTDENYKNYLRNIKNINSQIIEENLDEATRSDPQFIEFIDKFNKALASTFDIILNQEFIVDKHYTTRIGDINTHIELLKERDSFIEEAKINFIDDSTSLNDSILELGRLIKKATEIAIKQNILRNARDSLQILYTGRTGEINATTSEAVREYLGNAQLQDAARDAIAYNMENPYIQGNAISNIYMREPVDAQRNMLTEIFGQVPSTIVYHALLGPYWSYIWQNISLMWSDFNNFGIQSGFEGYRDAIRIGLQGIMKYFAFHAGMRAFASLYRIIFIATRGVIIFRREKLSERFDESTEMVQDRLSKKLVSQSGAEETQIKRSSIRTSWITIFLDKLGWWADGLSTFIRGTSAKDLENIGHSLHWAFNITTWGHIGVAIYGVLRVLSKDPHVQGAAALLALQNFANNWSWSVITPNLTDSFLYITKEFVSAGGIVAVILTLSTKLRNKLLEQTKSMVLSAEIHKVFLGYTISIALFSPYLIIRKLLLQLTKEEIGPELQKNQITKWSAFWVEFGASATDLVTWLLIWHWALPEWIQKLGLRYHHDDARDAIGKLSNTDTFPLIGGRDIRLNEQAAIFHEDELLQKANRLIRELSTPLRKTSLLFSGKEVFPTEIEFSEWAMMMKGRESYRDSWIIILDQLKKQQIKPEELEKAKEFITNIKKALKNVTKNELEKLLV